jgi:hypothetical protein
MRLPAKTSLVALVATSALAFSADTPQIPDFAKELPKIKTGEPYFKFNGKDLSGFYGYTKKNKYEDPQRVFTVQDGMIRISGEDFGGLATGGNFRDYHLIVEWKWGQKTWGGRVDRARDSGILLHGVGQDGGGPFANGQWLTSIECPIIEGGCGDILPVGGRGATVRPQISCEVRLGPDGQHYYQKGGERVTRPISQNRYNWWGRDPSWKDTLGFRGKRDLEKPTGEWNTMEVICDGSTITNIVNGYVASVGTDSSLTEGKIQIQSEGAEIFFRKFEVRPLIKPEAATAK